MDEQEPPTEGQPERYGDRVFKVRLALGDGFRIPMTLRDFDALIEDKTGRKIHASELSRIERHERLAILEDAEAIAAVDKEGRSPAWLIWGDRDVDNPDSSVQQKGLPPTLPRIPLVDPDAEMPPAKRRRSP
jgi:hypothetical protein